jgi:ABC-type nitrate/sulfonate/bicarbonate transport system permease component
MTEVGGAFIVGIMVGLVLGVVMVLSFLSKDVKK